jgi:hypothetical protein
MIYFANLYTKKALTPLSGPWTDVLMRKISEGRKSHDTVPLNGSRYKFKWFMLWIKTDAASAALRVKTKMQKTANTCFFANFTFVFAKKNFFFVKIFTKIINTVFNGNLTTPILQKFSKQKLCNSQKTSNFEKRFKNLHEKCYKNADF